MAASLRAYGVKGNKRRQPDLIDVHIPSVDGETVTRQRMAPSDIPAKAVFPRFLNAPGILAGREPEAEVEGDYVIVIDMNAADRARDAGEWGVSMFVHERAFMRMIAKIGHAQAVGTYGLDGFEPFLLPLIRDESGDWGHYLGGDIEMGSDTEHDQDIWVQVACNPFTGLVVGKMQFFGLLEKAPIYTVVIGRRRPVPFGAGMPELPWLQDGSMPLARVHPERPTQRLPAAGPDGPTPRKAA